MCNVMEIIGVGFLCCYIKVFLAHTQNVITFLPKSAAFTTFHFIKEQFLCTKLLFHLKESGEEETFHQQKRLRKLLTHVLKFIIPLGLYTCMRQEIQFTAACCLYISTQFWHEYCIILHIKANIWSMSNFSIWTKVSSYTFLRETFHLLPIKNS